MFDMDKWLMRLLSPFIALLLILICIWAIVKVVEHIWLELLIFTAAAGLIAACVFILWVRFRRW